MEQGDDAGDLLFFCCVGLVWRVGKIYLVNGLRSAEIA
jgi:hypothetical protein